MNAITKARHRKKPASKYHKRNVGASVPLVRSGTDLNCSEIRLGWNRVETAALGCLVEHRSTFICDGSSGALLRRTAEGGHPYMVLANPARAGRSRLHLFPEVL
jgi:hypothetical protein